MGSIRFVFFVLVFFCSLPKIAKAQPWEDIQWLRLLHYQQNWKGDYKSIAQDKSFFLSTNGKYSPRDEFLALQNSLQIDERNEDKNSYCRFPARVRWLQKKGQSVPPQKIHCSNLEEFRRRVSARSVYIVFSTYFLSNPVSSFGHTFMRLGKTESPSSALELMDTGVSYGAETGNTGFVTYAYKGLTGGFPGEFLAHPYYSKVREYNDSEMRDLWSYQLNFSQDEIDLIVDHLWELGQTHFDYYFMTENCSYHMLTLLEVARPDLNLVQNLSGLFVIPSDTLKVIVNTGLTKSISYRPSAERVSIQLNKTLTEEERITLPEIIKNPTLAQKFENKRQAVVLDAALVYLELTKEKELLSEESEAISLQRDLMLARAKIPVRSEKISFEDQEGNAPHNGHATGRLKIGSLNRDHKTWSTLGLRLGQHDVLDNETSYLPKTSLEMFELNARSDGKKIEVEDYTLAHILNLREMDEAKNSLSWKAKVGGSHEIFRHTERQKHGIEGGIGLSKSLGVFTLFALTHLEASYLSQEQTASFGTGTDLGLLLRFSSEIHAQTLYGLRDMGQNESFVQNELRLSTVRFGLGGKNRVYLRSHQHELIFNAFIYY